MHCNWAYPNFVNCAGGGNFNGAINISNGGPFYIGSGGIGYLQMDNQSFLPFADDWGVIGGAGRAFVGMEAYGFYNASDPRLKIDITQSPIGALDKVRAIPVIQYHLKTKPDEPLRTGFDASAVKQQFSGAVKVGTDEDKTLAINLLEMIAALWQAVQELSAKVADLEAQGQVG